jgi:predicted TIM-barrel fold metal-dependent hydrolase
MRPWIDTHVHFWDLKHPELTYGWLAPDAVHPILGDIDAIKSVRYDAVAFWAEARFSGLTGAVHVQAAVGTPDPVVETEWLTALARSAPVPFTIVAAADLAAADVERQLERHAASPLLRGIRDFGTGDYLMDPAFERGVARLARLGLLLDLDCDWPNMTKARDLALRHIEVPFVLEHIGYPRDTQDPEYFASWRAGITRLAQAPNAFCKISGLGMNRAGWTVGDLAPWVDHCVHAFGPERCVLGSNWPVDRLWGSYDAYMRAFDELLATYSPSEREAIAVGNALRLYRPPGDHS